MNANEIFNLRRFGQYIKYGCIIHRKTLLLGISSIAAALIVIAIVVGYRYADELPMYISINSMESLRDIMRQMELGWFAVSFYICGLILASVIFNAMNSRHEALQILTLPASQLEKFLCSWLVAVPCFVIVFFILAMFADWIRVLYVQFAYGVDVTTIDWYGVLTDPKDNGLFEGASKVFFFYYFFIQSFFFLGSIVWSRLSFFKTIVTLVALSTIYSWVGIWVYGMMHTPGYLAAEPFGISGENTTTLLLVTCTVVALFNYGLSYLRFTESETIKRW